MEVNPVSRWFVSVGKLNSTHLSDKDSTLVDESLNSTASCILGAVKRVVRSVSTASSNTLDVINIFDTQAQLSLGISRC